MKEFLNLYVQNETDTLEAVILGTSAGFEDVPKAEDCYDPKSKESVLKGIYPNETGIKREFDAILKVFEKYNVTVYRPEEIPDYNQVFARDVAFVIEDYFICSNIIEEREKEIKAIQKNILSYIKPKKLVHPPMHVNVEGGDVILYDDYIFVGTYRYMDYKKFQTARTNKAAIDFLKIYFPHKKVRAFDLVKGNDDPRKSTLHLDCCFQPVGHGKAIIYKEGFLHEEHYNELVNIFGLENMFHCTEEEAYLMFPNVFSISKDVVIVEENFERLANHMEDEWKMTVERVPYFEISKMGGLLRCTTMPLRRKPTK